MISAGHACDSHATRANLLTYDPYSILIFFNCVKLSFLHAIEKNKSGNEANSHLSEAFYQLPHW